MDKTLPAAFDPALETNEVLAAAKSPIFKKFNWAKKDLLYDTACLAHLLVVFGKEDEALEVCRTLGRLQLSAGKVLFNAVELGLALQARICRQRGNEAEATECHRRMREAGFAEQRLEGVLLDINGVIPEAIRLGDKKAERKARLRMAAEYVYIIELGGSAVYPIEKLEREHAENVSAIKELVGLKS